MKIDAIASATDTSTVTIPSSQSRESGIADFLVERKYGREMVDTSFRSSASNITYDVDVTANNKLTVRVILDDLTGDEITGRGAGTLNIHSGTMSNWLSVASMILKKEIIFSPSSLSLKNHSSSGKEQITIYRGQAIRIQPRSISKLHTQRKMSASPRLFLR